MIKNMLRHGYMTILLLLSYNIILTSSCPGIEDCELNCPTIKSFCGPPQGRFKARQLSGTTHFTHNHEDTEYHAYFGITGEYARSFRTKEILGCLFGSDLVCPSETDAQNLSVGKANTILIQGLAVPDRSPVAWFADYFYLPSDYSSSITFNPHITNFILDFDLYVNFDPCLEGLYFRAYAPLVHNRANLGLCETIIEAGTTNHPVGYFSPSEIRRDLLLDSFTLYLAGKTPNPLEVSPDNSIVRQPLSFARIAENGLSTTAFGELRAEFGWNAWQCGDYHMGINIQAAIPTASKRRNCYLFQPHVGNGHHWEFGAGLSAHFCVFASEHDDWRINMLLDANITHLFDAREQRTFDLRGKPNSAYMLASKFGPNGANTADLNIQPVGCCGSVALAPTPANAQFNFEYAPVANLTTLNVKVGVDLMADIVLMLSLQCRCLTFDLGYNFWGHTCETIDTLDPFCNTKQTAKSRLCGKTSDQWALKGDARMFGFIAPPSARADDPIALSATESKADIHNGTNQVPLDLSANDVNFSIDNPDRATNEIFDAAAFVPPSGEVLNDISAAQLIFTSMQPVFLKCEDIDFTRVRRISHKIVGSMTVACERGECWTPIMSIGGFAEFGRVKSCAPASETFCTSSCMDCALSQWGIWVKGGIAFG